jgi:hypothetical protein
VTTKRYINSAHKYFITETEQNSYTHNMLKWGGIVKITAFLKGTHPQIKKCKLRHFVNATNKKTF